jgi:deoxyuridine 5'-triphosphate nucleotidohydrolase
MKIKKLHENAIIPKYATQGSCGLDLYADLHLNKLMILEPYLVYHIGTGICLEFDLNDFGLICDKSSLGAKGIKVMGGVIDNDYRGEIIVMLKNLTHTPYIINDGDKIAQMIVLNYRHVKIQLVDELTETIRNDKGFGSTGK